MGPAPRNGSRHSRQPGARRRSAGGRLGSRGRGLLSRLPRKDPARRHGRHLARGAWPSRGVRARARGDYLRSRRAVPGGDTLALPGSASAQVRPHSRREQAPLGADDAREHPRSRRAALRATATPHSGARGGAQPWGWATAGGADASGGPRGEHETRGGDHALRRPGGRGVRARLPSCHRVGCVPAVGRRVGPEPREPEERHDPTHDRRRDGPDRCRGVRPVEA